MEYLNEVLAQLDMIEVNDYYYKKTRKGKVVLSNCIVMPLSKITYRKKGKIRFKLQLQAIVEGKKKEIVIVDSQEILKSDFLMKNWGAECIVFRSGGGLDLIRLIIQLLLKNSDEYFEYDQLGFQNIYGTKEMGYLHANGFVGKENMPGVIVSEAIKKHEIRRRNIDEKEALYAFIKLLKLAEPKTMDPLISQLFSGILFNLFREINHEIDYVVMLVASSGSLKSTLVRTVCGFFNKGDPKRDIDFTGTKNSIERYIYDMNSAVAIVDDIYTTSNAKDSSNVKLIAEATVRGVGNVTGKARLGANLELLETLVPNGSVVFTGEYSLSSESVLGRMFNINMKKNEININVLDEIQLDEVLLSTFIYNFIDWVTQNYNEVKEVMIERRDYHKKKIFAKLKGKKYHSRSPWTYISMMISLDIFRLYALHVDGITEYEFVELDERFQKTILKGILSQYEEIRITDPTYMYLNTISELITSNKIQMVSIGEKLVGNRLPCYEDEKYLYLPIGVSFNMVNRYLRDRDLIFPISEKSLGKALYENGIIDVEKGNNINYQKKKMIHGKERRRLLHIKKSEMEKYINPLNKKSKNKGVVIKIVDEKKSPFPKNNKEKISIGY